MLRGPPVTGGQGELLFLAGEFAAIIGGTIAIYWFESWYTRRRVDALVGVGAFSIPLAPQSGLAVLAALFGPAALGAVVMAIDDSLLLWVIPCGMVGTFTSLSSWRYFPAGRLVLDGGVLGAPNARVDLAQPFDVHVHVGRAERQKYVDLLQGATVLRIVATEEDAEFAALDPVGGRVRAEYDATAPLYEPRYGVRQILQIVTIAPGRRRAPSPAG